MPNLSSTSNALQRVAHGRKHISAAEAEFAAYLGDPKALDLELAYDTDRQVTRAALKVCTSLPASVLFAVADAFQSFRIALDMLWSELSAPTDPGVTYSFPWASDAHEAARVLEAAPAVDKLPILRDYIINRVMPWPQGNPIISGLFEITQRDRHGRLDLAFAFPQIISGKAIGQEGDDIDLAGFCLYGANDTLIGWPGQVSIREKARITLDLVFGPTETFAGNKVFDGLKHTHNQVAQIIHEVGLLISGKNPPSGAVEGTGRSSDTL